MNSALGAQDKKPFASAINENHIRSLFFEFVTSELFSIAKIIHITCFLLILVILGKFSMLPYPIPQIFLRALTQKL